MIRRCCRNGILFTWEVLILNDEKNLMHDHTLMATCDGMGSRVLGRLVSVVTQRYYGLGESRERLE